MLLDDLALCIEDNQGRDAAHVVLARSLTSDIAGHAKADHSCLARQVSFDPIHDGLGQ